ncbi:aquaporin-like protein [Sistotremastrum niveocremeum HHB9708]|uniref:Aquaporin-like protein n=1 Tax=Sistotremastrum niveocremeum HHB9708 TaxID=1314777 RepID=A0A165ABA8_9AGAM|nr:aquaporin-like protein [Sistotremastrum niveocremeum HHB9708]
MAAVRRYLSSIRTDLLAACLEFVGTILFLVLGMGGIQAAAFSTHMEAASVEQLLYISVSMGFALLASAWLFFRITGGVFNPQVSLALLLSGCISPIRFALFLIAQLGGSIVASYLLRVLTPGPLFVNVGLGPNVTKAQGVFVEAIATSALVFSVQMLAAEKHRSTAIAPIGIGLTLLATHMFAVVYTGAALNSARAFGPAVVSGFAGDHWVYWVGPTIGCLMSTTLYSTLKQCVTSSPTNDSDIIAMQS